MFCIFLRTSVIYIVYKDDNSVVKNRALNHSDLIQVTRISGPDSSDSDKTT